MKLPGLGITEEPASRLGAAPHLDWSPPSVNLFSSPLPCLSHRLGRALRADLPCTGDHLLSVLFGAGAWGGEAERKAVSDR